MIGKKFFFRKKLRKIFSRHKNYKNKNKKTNKRGKNKENENSK